MDIGQEDWQPASVREFDRIRNNLQLTREKRYSVIYRAGFGWFIAIVLFVVALILSACGTPPGRPGLRGCAGAPASPSCSRETCPCGHRRSWPSACASSSPSFPPSRPRAVTSSSRRTCAWTRTRRGHQVPEDIRLMVEPRRKPADFLGVQMQVAVNKGPNGNVPYMYSRVSLQGERAPPTRRSARHSFGDYEHEPGGDKEYGYVVVRQKTSGTGYAHHGRRRAAPVRHGKGAVDEDEGIGLRGAEEDHLTPGEAPALRSPASTPTSPAGSGGRTRYQGPRRTARRLPSTRTRWPTTT